MREEHLTLDDLLEDARYAEAAEVLDDVARHDPAATWALALRAVCLEEADWEGGAGLALARSTAKANPKDEFARWVAGAVLADRDRLPEAREHASAAAQLAPLEARNWALLASVEAKQGQWAACRSAAEQGLALDPGNEACAAYRSLSLRSSEFDEDWRESVDELSARFPTSGWARSGRGWAFLETGHAKEARAEFEQALALDPTSQWAREGLLQAVKAENPVYSAILQFFLWMERLPQRTRWIYIIGGWLVFRYSRTIAADYPSLAPLTYPIVAAWVFFIVASWTAEPISNFVLQRSEVGQRLVRGGDRLAANLVATLLGIAAVSTLVAVVTDGERAIGAALSTAFLIIPVAAVFQCYDGWPRKLMGAYSGLVALVFVATIAAPLPVMRSGLVAVILLCVAGSWLGTFLTRRVPAR